MIPRRTRNNFSPWSLNSKVARILSISWVNAWGQSATNATNGILWEISIAISPFPRMAGMVIKSCCRFLPCVMIWEDSPHIASDHPGGNRNLRKGNATMCAIPLSTIFWLMTNSKESGVEGVSRTWCLSLYEIWSSFAWRKIWANFFCGG